MKKLPSENKLRKLGYSDIGYAIYRYHGGMNAFRKMVGEPLKRDKFPGGKWKDLEFTLAEGKRITRILSDSSSHGSIQKGFSSPFLRSPERV